MKQCWYDCSFHQKPFVVNKQIYSVLILSNWDKDFSVLKISPPAH